jgi:RNA polymerase sigma-70 factor (ECF subfamily)
MRERDDERTVTRVLQGDTEAFGVLVRRYQKPIFNLMYRATGSMEDAADLAQEAFTRAYDKLVSYRSERKFFAWLYTIALNVARDCRRSNRRGPNMVPESEGSSALFDQAARQAHDPARRIEIQNLMQALGRLPIDYREALLLRYRQGFSMKEIAEMLQISVSGAKMRIHRGLAKLQQLLGEAQDAEQNRSLRA